MWRRLSFLITLTAITLGACLRTDIDIDSIEGAFLQVYPIYMFMNSTDKDGNISLLAVDYNFQLSSVPEEEVDMEIAVASKQALQQLGYKEGEKQVICCDLMAVKKGLCKQPYQLFPHDSNSEYVVRTIPLKSLESDGRITISISKTSEYFIIISSCDYRLPKTSLHGVIHAIQPYGCLPAESQIRYRCFGILLIIYLLLSIYTHSSSSILFQVHVFSFMEYFVSFCMQLIQNQLFSSFVEISTLSTILHSLNECLLILFILLLSKQIILITDRHYHLSLSQFDWKDLSALLLYFLSSLFPSYSIIATLTLSFLTYRILSSLYQAIHSLEYEKQENQILRLKQLYHSLFMSIILTWFACFLLQSICKQVFENEWIVDWLFEDGFSHILHLVVLVIITYLSRSWIKKDTQLSTQPSSHYLMKSFLPVTSFFLKLASLYHILSFFFLFFILLIFIYLPSLFQSLFQPPSLINSLEYDRSYQDKLLTPNSSILINYQPSPPLQLVFTTTLHESSSTLPIDMINSLHMYSLFEQKFPFKIIIFSSSPTVIEYCKSHSLVVVTQLQENPYHMPYVKSFLQTAKILYDSDHYGYINGDILLTSNIFSVLQKCKDLVKEGAISPRYIAAGRVYDLFDVFELKQGEEQFVDEFDSLLRKTVITRKLSLRHKHSADYFIFSKDVTFDVMAGIVVGRIRVDNYLLHYVVPMNGSVVNLSRKVIGIHQGACTFRCHTKNNNNRKDLNWNRGWRWSPRLGFGSLEYADLAF